MPDLGNDPMDSIGYAPAIPVGGTKIEQEPVQDVSSWVLPVAGMKSAPGDYASGEGNWARGSFGYKKPASKGGRIHEGVDIYAEGGTSIVAPVAGTITSAGYNKTSGYFVKLKGTDGIDYFFAHMDSQSPWASGSKVQSGIHIGGVGNSGNAAGTGKHLHFGMKKNGKSISPNDFLETGKQQKGTPLSAIPGLNTPEEIAQWANEEYKRQEGARAAARGFDPGAIQGIIDERMPSEEIPGFGQRFLGATLNSLSNSRMGGVGRVSMPRISATPNVSSALDGGIVDGSESGVPTAAAVDPALQREQVTDGRT